jgi:hypothetical protein
MSEVYLLLGNNFEWEDIIVITEKSTAINISLKYPDMRVEIFSKVDEKFIPSYKFFKNGKLYDNL